MNRILVVGANGTVGSEIVKLLRSAGEDVVSATSKAPSGRGQVRLELASGAGIEQAFAGVDRAFLMAPPGYLNQHEILAPLIEQAAQNRVRRVVLLSAFGADADESTPLRKAELHLERSGVPYNVLRPNWFMQNFNSYWIEGIVKAGLIQLPVADARTSFIDARDIAASAAALLLGETHPNQSFDLTGPESLTHADVAAILTEATGKQIRFEDITPAQMLPQLLAAGLPEAYSQFLVMILGLLKEGGAARITDAVQVITGRAPILFAQYARDYRSAWV
ncbi:MAG: NAD(P)H-binding protein [Pseudomonadota bacterium]